MSNIKDNGTGYTSVPADNSQPVPPAVTPNLGLPLARPMSKPTWLGTFNGAMSIIDNDVSSIDNGVKNFAESTQNQLTNLNNATTALDTRIGQNTDDIEGLTNRVTTLEENQGQSGEIRYMFYDSTSGTLNLIDDKTANSTFFITADGYYFVTIFPTQEMLHEQIIRTSLRSPSLQTYKKEILTNIGLVITDDSYGKTYLNFTSDVYFLKENDRFIVEIIQNQISTSNYNVFINKIRG